MRTDGVRTRAGRELAKALIDDFPSGAARSAERWIPRGDALKCVNVVSSAKRFGTHPKQPCQGQVTQTNPYVLGVRVAFTPTIGP